MYYERFGNFLENGVYNLGILISNLKPLKTLILLIRSKLPLKVHLSLYVFMQEIENTTVPTQSYIRIIAKQFI